MFEHHLTYAEMLPLGMRQIASLFQRQSSFITAFENLNAIGADRTHVKLGSRRFLMLTNPEDLEAVFKSKPEIAGHSRYQKAPLNDGRNVSIVTNSEGAVWARQRNHLAKFMGHGGLKQGFKSEAREIVARHIDTWREEPTIEVAKEGSRIALKYLFSSTFNLNISNDVCDNLHEAADALHRKLSLVMATLNKLPKRFYHALTNADEFYDTYYAIADNVIWSYMESSDDEKKKHMLTHVLSPEQIANFDSESTQQQVLASVNELLVAGHLSVRTSFYWAMHNLARQPQHQDAIYREALIPDKEFSVRPDRDGNIPDVTKFVMETLRLYPAFFVFLKEAKQDIETDNGLKIKAGTTIFIPPWLVHRSPEFYGDLSNGVTPDDFAPDTNFAPDAIKNRSTYAYLPFGHGPHHCPGNGLVLQEMVSSLLEISKRYELEPCVGDEALPAVNADIFLKPENDNVLRVKPRIVAPACH